MVIFLKHAKSVEKLFIKLVQKLVVKCPPEGFTLQEKMLSITTKNSSTISRSNWINI